MAAIYRPLALAISAKQAELVSLQLASYNLV